MQKIIQQIIRFGLIGVLATVIDFALLTGLTEWGHVHYLLSAGIAFVVATIFNYLASMRYVFVSRFSKEERVQELLLFVSLSVVGLILNQFFMWAFVEKLGIFYLLAKVLATFLVMAWNFISRKLWIE
ncbi:GtrA family protein [Aerococcus sanguinicola]|uniref:GtrA family protein n=1 Tax=unclassified Aerococcus TaxID=2618060 RepID=UPI0008A4C491|nr:MULTISPECIES: GtrA family protein [unclassified Aerococcus]MDK6233270.1 GtrA family protein [Aerococcus sp. UMB10185]MDK6804899.1 GtrA family protein [Aerococcus sp. UMB7834]MDK6855098.1 GtrA family protein [Aerococcus sp. UMB7533]MDK8501986.1 GtrA family protein [Aerococcus sp. UMB1112A]OFN04436.1 sugar translocase [Aerococcus sp. HMSC062A02]